MIEAPSVCVLTVEGSNCDDETRFAFELAGAKADIVHINDLAQRTRSLREFGILAIPGGFSYGDDVRSGAILSVELKTRLEDQAREFLEKGGLAIGICNGFQILAETGMLPGAVDGLGRVTLMQNRIGHFRCDFVNLRVEGESRSQFLTGVPESLSYMVAHGEGRFYTDQATLESLEGNRQVILRYVDRLGNPTLDYPDNPNQSLNAIAGICDLSGKVVGMMPHPERYVLRTQHPNWRRMGVQKPLGLSIFENMVNYARQS